MTAFLVAAYVLAATATATEVFLRMRELELRTRVEFRPDAEDIAVVVLSGLAWPLALVAMGWLKLYLWRGKRRGSSREG